MMKMDSTHPDGEAFIRACKDYACLINRNYPEKGTLMLIGDRYRLTGDQRTVLYRGITVSCHVLKSADYGLTHLPFDVPATSDSVIIEKAATRVVDLPRAIFESRYHADMMKITDLLSLPPD